MNEELIKLIFEAGAVERELSQKLMRAVIEHGKDRYIDGWNEASRVVVNEAELVCARAGINLSFNFDAGEKIKVS